MVTVERTMATANRTDILSPRYHLQLIYAVINSLVTLRAYNSLARAEFSEVNLWFRWSGSSTMSVREDHKCSYG